MKLFVVNDKTPGLTDQVRSLFDEEGALVFNHTEDFAGLLRLVHKEGIPDVLILDSANNEDLLKKLRQSKYRISVLVIIEADQGQEIAKIIKMGADAALFKPFPADSLKMRVHELISQNRKFFDIEYNDLISMCRIVEARDDITGHHVDRVGNLSYRIALALGLDKDRAEHIGIASRIHDIGKVIIPDRILNKPARLTPEEFDIVKKHTTYGAKIISERTYNSIFHLAREIILSHHERWDGHGYPGGLKGEEIPLSGRIVTVADVFDALTHQRDYKGAWTADEAVAYIKDESGKRFDPRVVKILALKPFNFSGGELLKEDFLR